MFKNIKKLFRQGRITEAGVKKAVKKKLITKEECQEILKGDSLE